MGTLTIGNILVDIDDELLDHMFVVLLAKLRRREPALVAWPNDRGGIEQVFVSPETTVRAEFTGGRRADLDRRWLDRLMVAANSTTGICLATAEMERHSRVIPSPPPLVFRHSIVDEPIRTAALSMSPPPDAGRTA